MDYIQCYLKKDNREMTAWIPESFALLNKQIKLKDDDKDEWENGWVIAATYGRKDEKDVLAHERDYIKFSVSTEKK